ncbi:MAG: energy transducer TonB [Lentimicrobiaceae bacterium]|nr:energy transducer TonB [Lentimicrobiaceae bacterium]
MKHPQRKMQMGLLAVLLVVCAVFQPIQAQENKGTTPTRQNGLDLLKSVETQGKKGTILRHTRDTIIFGNIAVIRDTIVYGNSDTVVLGDSTVKFIEDKYIEVSETVPFIWYQMPEFPGGEYAMMLFIRDNVIFPRIEGKNAEDVVIVSVIVEEDGSLTNIKIEKSVCPAFDEEAIRVVKLMPKWKPGIQRGKAAQAQQMIPVKFTRK